MFVGLCSSGSIPDDSRSDYYTDEDLRIGITVNVFGRELFIVDCDEFTRNYIYDHFGDEYVPLETEGPTPEPPPRVIPPYNGFGSEEDSIQNVCSLVPKPPKKDFQKLMQNDTLVLRFSATLLNGTREDSRRQFNIMFFLADDTMTVFEPLQTNSGFLGGKFLQRRKFRKGDGRYFEPQDLKSGRHIIINSYEFLLGEPDGFTRRYFDQYGWNIEDDGTIDLAAQTRAANNTARVSDFYFILFKKNVPFPKSHFRERLS